MIPARHTTGTRPPRRSAEGISTGFPAQIALALAELTGATVFVETGTYCGTTARLAAKAFARVYTIERAESLFQAHSPALRALGNVEPLLGDSREVLPKLLPALHGQRAVFWLDGHWSGEETAGRGDECPLLAELAAIAARVEDTILIDDARLFLCAPPRPHDASQWPTIAEIVAALGSGGARRYLQVVDDVIIAVPDAPRLVKSLTDYAQERASIIWEAGAKSRAVACDRGFISRLQRQIRAWSGGQPRSST